MKAVFLILLPVGLLLGAATWAAVRHYDGGNGRRDSFFARFLTTFLGVCIAATLSYGLWSFQQWQVRNGQRSTVKKSLAREIESNRAILNDLAGYLGRLEKWASALDAADSISKDFMMSSDAEKGEQLKEILPYRQVSFAASDAMSKGTLALLSEELQGKVRKLAWDYEELNHRLDYCEKSSSDLVYTMRLVRPSQEERKSLMVYQARSVIRFLKEPTESMMRLCDGILGLLSTREGVKSREEKQRQEPPR